LGDLFAMALGGSILGLVIASRFAEMLNVVLRGPRGTPVPLTQVPLAPAIAGAALLLGISLLGSLVPIRRVTKQSVANGLR
jgi:predicted lysophospholipase L1 biosynthesis ABC-type transport system permease subunit